jgi:hypothetical protein
MEAIFSLPYSEHQTIASLSRVLPKSQGYGVFVPVSRQQAGVDLVITHSSREHLRAQVKSSRHFDWARSPTLRFWYRNFLPAYRPGVADIFLLFGLYPVFAEGKKVTDRNVHWRHLVLALSDGDMGEVLHNTGKDRFFQFGIDPSPLKRINRVVGTRGGVAGRDLTPFLLENRAEWLRDQLGSSA